jgi:hypothetical protein
VIATLIGDAGSNYRATYYNESWVDKRFAHHGGLPVFRCWKRVLGNFLDQLEQQHQQLGGAQQQQHQKERDSLAGDHSGDPIVMGAMLCGKKSNGIFPG